MKYLIEYLHKDEWWDVSDNLGYPPVKESGNEKYVREYCKINSTWDLDRPLRIVIETPVEWDGDPADEDTEATDWEYETYAVYVNGAEWFPNPSPVIIEVLGGVAEVASAPEWLTVEIRDYDNEPEEIGEDE